MAPKKTAAKKTAAKKPAAAKRSPATSAATNESPADPAVDAAPDDVAAADLIEVVGAGGETHQTASDGGHG